MTEVVNATTAVPGSESHSHGHGAPIQTRSERPASYEIADFPMPNGNEVNWKLSPLQTVKSLLAELSEDSDDAAEITVSGNAANYISDAPIGSKARGSFFKPEDRPGVLTWNADKDGLLLQIPENEEVSEPIWLEISGSDSRSFAHIVIEAMPNSTATVVLDHKGHANLAENVEILTRTGSKLTLIALQRWDAEALHLANHQATVEKDAHLRHFVISFSGKVVRVNPSIELTGAGAEAEIFGLSYADAGQHLESQVYMYHKGPHTKGNVLYKGALQGESARSVWIGDVLIGSEAIGTDSYEANRNLVLTDGARAYSVPNLEIESGNIQGAGHASATGRFDDEQLFYLQSRGISELEARRLVVIGFLQEIVQKLNLPELQQELSDAIEKELEAGAYA